MFLWVCGGGRRPLRDRRRIRSFRDQQTKSIFEQQRVAGYEEIAPLALRRLAQIDSAEELCDLASSPGNGLEARPGGRAGEYSVRVGDRHRISFLWRNGDAFDVEIENCV